MRLVRRGSPRRSRSVWTALALSVVRLSVYHGGVTVTHLLPCGDCGGRRHEALYGAQRRIVLCRDCKVHRALLARRMISYTNRVDWRLNKSRYLDRLPVPPFMGHLVSVRV